MQTTVLLFGQLAEIAQSSSLIIDADSTDVLQNKLFGTYPGLKNIPFRISLNQSLIDGNTLIQENDTIALLPPFSGG